MTAGTPLICINCGYDLSVSSPDGRCSECGLEAERSRTSPLQHATWWKHHRRGGVAIAVGVGLYWSGQVQGGLLLIVPGLANSPLFPSPRIAAWTIALYIWIAILGSWWLTSPLPGETKRIRNRRRLVRAMVIATAGAEAGWLWPGFNPVLRLLSQVSDDLSWLGTMQKWGADNEVPAALLITMIFIVFLLWLLRTRGNQPPPFSDHPAGTVILFLTVLVPHSVFYVPLFGSLWMFLFVAIALWMREIATLLNRPGWGRAARIGATVLGSATILCHGGQLLGRILYRADLTSSPFELVGPFQAIGYFIATLAIFAIAAGTLLFHRSVKP